MIIDTTQTKIEREIGKRMWLSKYCELLKDIGRERQRIDMLYGSKLRVTSKPIRVSSSEVTFLAAGESDEH